MSNETVACEIEAELYHALYSIRRPW